jgi:prepilin-type N-terminal cleavage/methylation domain-containing protein
MKNFNKKNKHNKGFTLIEVLVSLSLFSVVLVIVGGTIVSVIGINKRNQLISSVVNNLNYSVDSMVRDIKTGYLYKCNYDESFEISSFKNSANTEDGTCSQQYGLTLISTISGADTVVNYKFIPPENGNGYIEKTVYEGGVPSSYSITDKINVNIDHVNFVVKNADALDCQGTCNYGQPSVFLMIKGKAGNQDIEVSNFYLQTFISQRVINITDFNDNN